MNRTIKTHLGKAGFVSRIAHSALTNAASLFAGLAVLVLGACSEAKFDYSSQKVRFSFNNAVYQDATLQSALNPMSPGVFCRIYEGMEGISRYFYFESNQGLTSRKKATAEDTRRTCIIGVYNKTGIIVGYGNLSSPAPLYAYDSQCPNCYAEKGTPSFKLSLDPKGIATCPTCKRTYDLNNNGITANGDKLMKYRASCTDPLGLLSVVNN